MVVAGAGLVAWSQSFALVVVTCLAFIHLSYSGGVVQTHEYDRQRF